MNKEEFDKLYKRVEGKLFNYDADEIVDYIKDIEDFEKYISLSEIEQETLDTIEEDMDELEMEM